MKREPSKDSFTPEEAQKRMEAALRGARISGHKSMSEIAPKRSKRSTATKRKGK